MNAWVQGRQSDLSKAEYGSVDYSKIMTNIADMNAIKTVLEQSMRAGIDAAQFDLEPLWEKVFDGDNIPDNVWQGMVDKINEKLKEIGIEPIKIDFKTGSIAKEGEKTEKSWQAAAQAVQSVGGAMQSIEDPAAKVAGTIAQAIASIALGYAQATTQAATLGPWAWVAFAATGMAQMISMISAIHSSTGYAEGGIIKGNSYSGDNLMAQGPNWQLIGLNAGEVVLNRAQQGVIAGALQGGGQTVHVVGKLSGESLFICAENWAKRSGKGEFVTWRQ
jgi:coenzyme F420-reducing hydrogenase delta subunit